MLLIYLLPLALATTSSAGVIRTRTDATPADVAGMLQVLDRINAGMSKIGADVKFWEGSREGAEQIMEDGRQIISDLGVGARFIEHQQVVGTVESLQLLSPMSNLNTLTDTFANILIQKKPMIDRLQLAPQTLTLLEHARHGALDLSREVALKMPPLTSWGAQPATNLVVDKLDKAIKVFGGQPGIPGERYSSPPASPAPFSSNPYAQPANQGQYEPRPGQNQYGGQVQQASNPYSSSIWSSNPYNSSPQPQQNQNARQFSSSKSQPEPQPYQDTPEDNPVTFSAPPAGPASR